MQPPTKHQLPRHKARSTYLLASLTLLMSCITLPAETVAQFIASLRPPPNQGFYARFRMQTTNQQNKQTLQLHIKGRSTKNSNDLLCQIIYPKHRKGEGILIRRKNGQLITAARCTPQGQVKTLTKQELGQPLFGSAMCLDDFDQSFLNWPYQRQREKTHLGKIPCVVIESRPKKSTSPVYSLVVSSIDHQKRVALKTEKYTHNNQLARIITSNKIVKLRNGQHHVKKFTVSIPGTQQTTIVEGVSRKEKNYDDSTFTLNALKHITGP